MSHINYIVKRLLQILPVLLCVTILIFAMMRLIPGDPARIQLGENAREAAVQALRLKMGLDEPLVTQYFIFMKQLITLDLGTSLLYKIPVVELISQRIGLTFSLAGVSMFFIIIISFPLGYIAGMNKDKAADQTIRVISLAAISMPSFWLGILLMLLFGVKLGLLPVGGWGSTPLEHLQGLILPGIASAMVTAALVMRNLRNSIVDINNLDYVDFARSKGLMDKTVKKNYIMRNALLSAVTLLSMRFAWLLGGSVVIETVFALPGIGKLLVDSIFARDYPVVQSVVFLLSFSVLVINLITDVLYAFLDPRIRL